MVKCHQSLNLPYVGSNPTRVMLGTICADKDGGSHLPSSEYVNMPKPLGVAMTLVDGQIGMAVRPIDRAVDAIWDCVEECIGRGMTPAQFKAEAAEAWRSRLREEANNAYEELLIK